MTYHVALADNTDSVSFTSGATRKTTDGADSYARRISGADQDADWERVGHNHWIVAGPKGVAHITR